MVPLVFRPYTQIRRTICTSVSLRASTRVSPGFALPRHSSPSFGSQQVCSHSDLLPKLVAGRRLSCVDTHFHYAYRVTTRTLAHVYGLLGPCFKTGQEAPCRSTPRESRLEGTTWRTGPSQLSIQTLRKPHPRGGTRQCHAVTTQFPLQRAPRRARIRSELTECVPVLTLATR